MSAHKMSMSHLDSYLKYLRFAEELNREFLLDGREVKMLDLIFMREQQGFPLNVSQLMSSSDLGSPATNHKVIAQLVRKEMIEYQILDDRRVKYVCVSERAKKRYAKLGRYIHESGERQF